MTPDDPNRRAFFDRLFRDRNVKTVLDCACGTGSDALLFHSLGYKVAASDLSESMLAVARRKFQQHNVDIPLRCADFHYLPKEYDRHFDAVICLTNAINELPVNTEHALQSMAAVLAPNGIMVFDQGQTDFTLRDPPRYVPVANTPTLSRLFVMNYQTDIMTVEVFDFVHDERSADYDFFRSKFEIHLRRLADWKEMLQHLNMDAQFFGSWKGEPYDIDGSTRLIVVAARSA